MTRLSEWVDQNSMKRWQNVSQFGSQLSKPDQNETMAKCFALWHTTFKTRPERNNGNMFCIPANNVYGKTDRKQRPKASLFSSQRSKQYQNEIATESFALRLTMPKTITE